MSFKKAVVPSSSREKLRIRGNLRNFPYFILLTPALSSRRGGLLR
jgi:hypothetical protein